MNAPRQSRQPKPRRGVPFIAQGKAPRRRSPVTVAINSIRAVSATQQTSAATFRRTYSAQLIVDADTGLRAHSSRLPCATNGTPRWGFGLLHPYAETNRPTGAKQRSIWRLCRPMNPRTQLIPPCKGGAKTGALSMSECCCAALTGRIHFIARFISSRAPLARLTLCYVPPPLWGGDRAHSPPASSHLSKRWDGAINTPLQRCVKPARFTFGNVKRGKNERAALSR